MADIISMLSNLYGAGKAFVDAAGAPRPGNQQAASNKPGSLMDFIPQLLTQDMQTQGGKVRDPAARAKQFGPQGIDWIQANGPERESVKQRQAALDASIGPDPRYGAVEMTPENTKWAEEQLKGVPTGPSNPGGLTRDLGGGMRVAMGRDGQPVGYSADPLSAYEPQQVVDVGAGFMTKGDRAPLDGFTSAERQRLQGDIQNAANWGLLQKPPKATPASAPREDMMESSVIPGESGAEFLSMFDEPASLPMPEQAQKTQAAAMPDLTSLVTALLAQRGPASGAVQPRQDPRPSQVNVTNPWTNAPSDVAIDLGKLYDVADQGDQMIGDQGAMTDVVKFMQDLIKPSYQSVPAGAPTKQRVQPTMDPALMGLPGTIPGYLQPLDTKAQQRKAALSRALDSFNPASMFQR